VVAFGSGDINGTTFSLKPVANQPGYGANRSPQQPKEDINYKALLNSMNRIPPGGKQT